MAAEARSRYELSRAGLAELLGDQPSYRVDQVWRGLYERCCELSELTDVPRPLRARLSSEPALHRALSPVSTSSSDAGATVKWLWELADGVRVETVLMHYPGRSTVCVSTQAGCAMACGFCATGQAGFTRNLRTGEIVEQVALAAREARAAGRRLSNVVFMGMGEPLANYEPVWSAVERLHGELGLSARHLTLSTVGLVPGIDRLAGERLPVNLAVSLHAANDALRSCLVPINRRYPIGALMEACGRYRAERGRRLSFEWALIDAVNDRPSDAAELAGLAGPLGAHVNLIPLNDQLNHLGVNATIRQNRGTAIDAACGQLAARAGSQPVALASRTPRPAARLAQWPSAGGPTTPSPRPSRSP